MSILFSWVDGSTSVWYVAADWPLCDLAKDYGAVSAEIIKYQA